MCGKLEDVMNGTLRENVISITDSAVKFIVQLHATIQNMTIDITEILAQFSKEQPNHVTMLANYKNNPFLNYSQE
ncbi:unnamed protein product [Caenorhabditis nigoni]